MKQASLISLAVAAIASAGAYLPAGSAAAATVTISGVNCSWDQGSETLSCNTSTGPTNPSAPVCSINASANSVAAGSLVTVTASCSGAGSYQWTKNGTGTMAGGSLSETVSATTVYAVRGCDANGANCGNYASTTVTVQGGGTTPGGNTGGDTSGMCANVPNAQIVDVPWKTGFATQNMKNGGFAADATLVVRFTVPADYRGTGVGSVSISEYGGPPTNRLVTLSTQACDFRISGAFDLTGASAPMGAATGTTASVQWSSAMPGFPRLVPGQTYYFNVQNKDYRTGRLSCAQGTACNAIVLFSVPNQ